MRDSHYKYINYIVKSRGDAIPWIRIIYEGSTPMQNKSTALSEGDEKKDRLGAGEKWQGMNLL